MKTKKLHYGFLTDMVGLELRRAQIHAEKRFFQAYGGGFLPGHYTVLVLIQKNPGATQSAIAKAAGLDRSSLVPLLKQFEQKGFVVRRKDSVDSRSNITELTKEGEAFLEEHRPVIERLEEDTLERLGDKDYKKLLLLLKAFQETP